MMTKNTILSYLTLAAALVAVAPRAAHAWTRPIIQFAAGSTFGADGAPADGGASVALSPMWSFTDHARFGVTVFADDIGSDLVQLYDRNDGTNLGTVASGHRWTWGAAWRGDLDLARRDKWTAGASGTWGWWRIEDDLRGTTTNAASAVGVGLGGTVRRQVAATQSLGLIVRWQRLFAERNSAYRRAEHYSSAAVEWGWSGAPRP